MCLSQRAAKLESIFYKTELFGAESNAMSRLAKNVVLKILFDTVVVCFCISSNENYINPAAKIIIISKIFPEKNLYNPWAAI